MHLIDFFSSRIMVVILLLLLSNGNGIAQNMSIYNLNYKNGLPADHAYFLKKDRLGYLWIATAKGVVKYNGYTLKKFGRSAGISNDDIWSLYEDAKGRMWLASISKEIGYIADDQYNKCILGENNVEIYPRGFTEYNGHIVLLSLPRQRRDWRCYFEHGDTLSAANLSLNPFYWRVYLDRQMGMLSSDDSSLYTMSYNSIANRLVRHDLCMHVSGLKSQVSYYLAPWVIFSSLLGTDLFAINTVDCSRKRIAFSNAGTEKLYTTYLDKDYYYIITNEKLYIYNKSLSLLHQYPFAHFIGNHAPDNIVSYTIKDSTWGTCTSTTNGGVYFSYGAAPSFRIVLRHNALGFHYIGQSLNGTNMWWNSTHRQLLSIDCKGAITQSRQPFFEIRKIVPFNQQQSLLLADTSIFLLDQQHHTSPFFRTAQPVNRNQQQGETFADRYKSCVVTDPHTIYTIGAGSGLIRYSTQNDVVNIDHIYMSGINDILYDRKRKIVLAYNESLVYVYNVATNKKDTLNNLAVDSRSGSGINKILFDSSTGRVIIQYYDRLIAYDYTSNTYSSLFENLSIEDCYTFLDHHRLFVCGRFGIAYTDLTEPSTFTKPVIISNTKGMWYNSVSDACISGESVIVNTDNGLLQVPLASANNNSTPLSLSPRYTISYKQHISGFRSGDTLSINQDDRQVTFDIINPAGIGTPVFKCNLPAADGQLWKQLAANEYTMPQLSPGNYYTLAIRVKDDAWESSPMTLVLYLRPYWWQTRPMAILFYITGILMIAFVFFLAAHITRKKVTQKSLHRQHMLELELKSLYAQINPHFIFNTLNSAQLLISKGKTDAAYIHINKFSKLLRSYIHSSRNKYVRLEDELENLRNYIELQQSRFKDKFIYKIELHEAEGKHIYIPSLLLQPIVENAISHGLFHKEGPGLLIVGIIVDAAQDTLTCIIEDNGIGRKEAAALQNTSVLKRESFGSKLIEELSETFNRYERTKIAITYIDKELPETGTIVRVVIKNIHYGS